MPEQQREPSGERPVQRRGRPASASSTSSLPSPSRDRHAAVGHENETETIEKVQLDGLGRDVATAGLVARHFAAARLHRGKQPGTTTESAPQFGVEETV